MKPRDAEHDAVGQIARSADRTAIVRYLRTNPGAYFGAIGTATGISLGSLGKHLRDLENQGIVTADLPREVRRGRSARWSIDTDRLRHLIRRFEDEVLG